MMNEHYVIIALLLVILFFVIRLNNCDSEKQE